MRFPSYLVKTPSGFFHFRFMVPVALRDALGLSVIKRSLHTKEKRTAQCQALFWAAAYAHAFDQEWPDMTKTLEELLASATGARRSEYELVPTAYGYQVKSEGEEDHRRALEALAVAKGTAPTPVHAQVASQEVKTQRKQQVSLVKSPIALSKAIIIWLAKLTEAKPLAKTLGQKKKSVETLLKFVGEKRVDKLTEADFSGFITHMRTHRDVTPKQSKQGKKPPIGLAESTIDNRMVYVIQFMKWAMKMGHYPRGDNPAADLHSYTKADKEERALTHGWQAFSAPQIQSIFDRENFVSIGKEHTRWCLVMAVYTGARVNELAQLTVDDFAEVKGVKYFSIDTQEENQSIKSPHSRRTLPIHQDLLTLGLWERMERLREAGETQLFPLLKHGQNHFGGAVTTAASRYIASLRIKPRGSHRLGVHSFRNALIQHLDECEVDDLASRVYVGHTINKDSHDLHYKNAKKQKKKINLFLVLPHLPAPEWGIDLAALKPLLDAPQGEKITG